MYIYGHKSEEVLISLNWITHFIPVYRRGGRDKSHDFRFNRRTHYNDDSMLPVYKWTSSQTHFSIEELARVLLCDIIPENKICSTQPVRVCHNVSFIVNLDNLNDEHDIRADENGVWERKGSPVAYVSVHSKGSNKYVVRRNTIGSHSNSFKLTRVYYRHSKSPDFRRIITTVYGRSIVSSVRARRGCRCMYFFLD